MIDLITSLFNRKNGQAAPASAKPSTSFYDFKMPALEGGEPVDFQQFKGKKIIILNVASKCGYTPQYADWEAFYEENKDKGVVVLGFPANNFLSQEPGSNEDIASFCQRNYGVTFPMFQKVSVKGDGQDPLYKWLTTKELNGWNEQAPTWNFCKYVVDEKGHLTHFFGQGVKPGDKEFQKAMAGEN